MATKNTKTRTHKRDYLTSKEKLSMLEALNKITVRFEKKAQSLRPGSYDRSFVKDAVAKLEEARKKIMYIY